MSLTMPGGLQEAFGWLGLDWPQADEDKLFASSDHWADYATKLRTIEQDATASAQQVWTSTTGSASEAFGAWWVEHPQHDLQEDAGASDLVSAMLQGFGALTVALKGVYIAQLVVLAAEIAQAVATAVLTFGLSMLEIPGFAAAVRFVVKTAVDQAIAQVMA